MIQSPAEVLDLDPERRAERVGETFGQPVLPPKDMRVEREGNLVSLVLRDRGRFVDSAGVSGADHYAVYWAEDVDEASVTTIDAGAARAEKIGDVARAWIEDKELPFDVTSGRYQNGFFFVYGANVLGHRSERYLFSGRQTNVVLDTTIPDNVSYFTGSESGSQEQGVVVSRFDWRYYAPWSPSFDGVKWVLKDYPNLGDAPTHFLTQKYLGAPGGLATGFFHALPARRVGIGTVSIVGANVTVGGGRLLTQAQPGDLLEVLGVRAEILSVTGNTAMVLTAPWTGEQLALYDSWTIIGKVTVYAVSVSKGGTSKSDHTTSPSVATHFDAELSPPLQPSLTATAGGNLIRLLATLASGPDVDRAVLYRGTGSGISFGDCVPIHVWTSDKIKASGPTLAHEDSDFSTYEREQGQLFSYYVVVVNVRGQQSPPSVRVESSCRLNSGSDGSDPGGKLGLFNKLFNGFIAGLANNVVLASDTTQDTHFPVIVGVDEPGRPYGDAAGNLAGVGRFAGYTRWTANDGGSGAGGSVFFDQGTEVRISSPGVGKVHYLYQEVEAWDTLLGPSFVRLKKDGVYCWSVYLARTAGAMVNGEIGIYIDLYDNGTFRGEAPRRYRDSGSDALLWTPSDATAHVDVAGSDLTENWKRYYGVFKLDSSVGSVKQCRFNVLRINGTTGIVRVCQAMVNEGEEIGVFTAAMDLDTSWPVPGDPAGYIGDGSGWRKPSEGIYPP